MPLVLLQVRTRWQPVLDGLPSGGVLVLLPPAGTAHRQACAQVAGALAGMGYQVSCREAAQFLPAWAGAAGTREGGAMAQHTSDRRWEVCQIEREEQLGFFGSTVVFRAVVTGTRGRRVLAATDAGTPHRGSSGGGWEALADRLVADGWEPVSEPSSALPTFRRPIRSGAAADRRDGS